jgi:hypothetical protein
MNSRVPLLIGTALTATGVAYAQAPEPRRVMRQGPGSEAPPRPALPDTEENRRTILGELADTLEQNYVFPDIARRYAEALRTKAASGGYANLGESFGETVTADLQAIHADRHLRFGPAGASPAGPGPRRAVMGPGASGAPSPGSAGSEPRRVMRMPDPSTAIRQSGWIADGVAYIDIGLFPGTPEVVERFRAFMEAHKDARAIVFDIRGHRGGGLAEMDVIFSYLYPRETLLVGMDTRTAAERGGGNPLGGESATLRRASAPDGISRRTHHAVPGPDTALRRAPIFLLTSRRSGSAAEHFALALKRTHRATLIGETTAGAGHYGRMVDFGGYAAFVPVGRTFDPDNDWDWEGRGVPPDVAVPADQALDEALRRLGVTPEQRRSLTPA